ncbi:protein of unknown function [Xenorhabdus poinarii G6]|uniref:Uncharacterized protein n=1 Tax=Xenorhabdus poinarii G6 TaxID=1354304 RepID=A0A068R356_9GAMM|nr:protein of unknown function [Xenorhabdus poinarii G6]
MEITVAENGVKAPPHKSTQPTLGLFKIREALRLDDSKRTGIVGWQRRWEGWFKLQTLLEGYQLALSLDGDNIPFVCEMIRFYCTDDYVVYEGKPTPIIYSFHRIIIISD